MKELVQGVGINDIDEDVKVDGKHLPFYRTWVAMLNRCYSTKLHLTQPTYIGCTVCEEWKYLSNFKKWYEENYIEGFQLDKDILVEGNKVYSPERCRFVPQYLNLLLNTRNNDRGSLPLGVIERKIYGNNKTTSYYGKCNGIRGEKLSKTFKTIHEAQAWYSETKKRIVKEQATRAFLENAIKTDVYLALIRRNF